jgi:hypothetical protein
MRGVRVVREEDGCLVVEGSIAAIKRLIAKRLKEAKEAAERMLRALGYREIIVESSGPVVKEYLGHVTTYYYIYVTADGEFAFSLAAKTEGRRAEIYSAQSIVDYILWMLGRVDAVSPATLKRWLGGA